jgi:hypothetical protein
LTKQPHLRFAVGCVDSWLQFGGALEDLHFRGFGSDCFNCLALQRVLVGMTLIAPSQIPLRIEELAFPEGSISCTAGSLCDSLRDRLVAGARSFKEALAHWLIPRHAAYFQTAVESGKIQLWIRLMNADDERRAYHSLLACSSNSVGVHDLISAPRRNGSGR